MCFRPSVTSYDEYQTDACPNCGMPVAYQEDVTEGICPYCGQYIPPESPSSNDFDPNPSHRII